MFGNMTSLSAHLPHENEGGTEEFSLQVTNGYHDSHFEKERNGFITGGKEPTKLPVCENSTKIKVKPGKILKFHIQFLYVSGAGG